MMLFFILPLLAQIDLNLPDSILKARRFFLERERENIWRQTSPFYNYRQYQNFSILNTVDSIFIKFIELEATHLFAPFMAIHIYKGYGTIDDIVGDENCEIEEFVQKYKIFTYSFYWDYMEICQKIFTNERNITEISLLPTFIREFKNLYFEILIGNLDIPTNEKIPSFGKLISYNELRNYFIDEIKRKFSCLSVMMLMDINLLLPEYPNKKTYGEIINLQKWRKIVEKIKINKLLQLASDIYKINMNAKK